jgi:Ni/Co efflux regulator RcnB
MTATPRSIRSWRTTLSASAVLCVLVLAAVFTPEASAQQATAQQATAVAGHSSGVQTSVETLELPDGRTVRRTSSTAQVTADDPSSILHLASQTCHSATVYAADGTAGPSRGGCNSVSPDGDVIWITLDGGTWQWVGGTGQFAGIEGGGTWSNMASWSDGQFINRWEGSLTGVPMSNR